MLHHDLNPEAVSMGAGGVGDGAEAYWAGAIITMARCVLNCFKNKYTNTLPKRLPKDS